MIKRFSVGWPHKRNPKLRIPSLKGESSDHFQINEVVTFHALALNISGGNLTV